MAELQEGWVRITHPGLEGEETHECPRDAFEEVWKAKGWEIVEEPVTDVDLTVLKVGELKDLAAERGIQVDSSARKDDLIAALEANPPAGAITNVEEA